MDRRHFSALAMTSLAMAAIARPAQAAKTPTEWDGLVKVKSKRFDKVYLRPGADFRAYTKVMLDPTEIAFYKNWQRDYNADQATSSMEVTDKDMHRWIEEGRKSADEIVRKAYAKGGYPVVEEAAADVLRVHTAVIDIIVRAPDIAGPMMVRSYSREAGEATLVVEARDSLTGSLLGRAVDDEDIDDNFWEWRTRASNRVDFDNQVETWAKNSVKGLDGLKALSPIKG